MIIGPLKQAIMITNFVFVMMLIVEYINVQSQGGWARIFTSKRWRQYIFAGILGALPGCLGAFTATTLFGHGVLSFGALVATMVTTSGDEAFIMFALIPKTALLITVVLFASAIVLAIIVDRISDHYGIFGRSEYHELPFHEKANCDCFDAREVIPQLRALTFHRFLIISLILALLIALITGTIGPQSWDWKRTTFLFGGLITLFIVSTVPDHFLQEHLWEHLIKIHLPRIFMWTFMILLALNILKDYWAIDNLIDNNYYIVLLLAALVGMIPQSGPHFVFVALFLEGSLPLSILIASSASQDGHGTLPLLAESKKAFIYLKLINLVWGIFLGLIFHSLGH